MRVIPFYTHGHSTHVSVQSLIRPLLGLCFDIEVVSMSFFLSDLSTLDMQCLISKFPSNKAGSHIGME